MWRTTKKDQERRRKVRVQARASLRAAAARGGRPAERYADNIRIQIDSIDTIDTMDRNIHG